MNKPKDCPRFEYCSALCPLSEANDVWYPDEEICQLSEFRGLEWIRRQRKLSRMAVSDNYFTRTMLERNCIIRSGICGLDPDHPLSSLKEDERKWLKEHPEKRELTEEERESIRQRFIQAKESINAV